MYSFPKITIPPAAIAAAKAIGKEPDVMYCLELLEETGTSISSHSLSCYCGHVQKNSTAVNVKQSMQQHAYQCI